MPTRAYDQIFAIASTAWESGNLKLAYDLFSVGAKHGDSASQISLGYFYDLGIHVPKSKSRALFWYRSAYRDGSCSAASNIATVYRDTKEYGKMIWWLRKAISMGDGDALLDLGRCYLRGIGVRKNRGKAAALFEQVLKSDHVTLDGEENARRELKRLTARPKPRGHRTPTPSSQRSGKRRE